MKVQFSIAGNPQGKARPRFSRGHAYTPDATKKYETMTAFLYRRAANGFFFSQKTPLSVTILVFFAAPKNTSKKKKEVMLNGEAFPVRKPDADNIAKIILDALNGTAYHDDAQIVQLSVRKQYAEKNSVEVILEDICQREK